jgi:hypothetical protein
MSANWLDDENDWTPEEMERLAVWSKQAEPEQEDAQGTQSPG